MSKIFYTNNIERYGNVQLSLQDLIHTTDDRWDAYGLVIKEAFICLTFKQKQVMNLWLNNYRVSEIAKKLNRKPSNVIKSINTAKKRLTKMILKLSVNMQSKQDHRNDNKAKKPENNSL